MALNLVKLCVGVDTLEDLAEWRSQEEARHRAKGLDYRQFHTTRMIPRRMDELLDGGSLYWVIKGNVQVRQRLVAIEPFRDDGGIERCRLVLDRELVPTRWQPRRAFQGWRYLDASDAPADLAGAAANSGLPAALHVELSQLGLL
jgi:hypothetical protein